MGKIINIDDLHRAAKHYDPVLKTLPFVQLEPVLANLGIRFLEVLDGDNIEVNFERNGSFLKPYSVGTSDKDADDKEAGRFTEMPLTPKKAYCALKDHIDNYETVKVLGNAGEQIDQEKKNHPLEKLILESKIRTVGEDLVDALFHSTRDEQDASPMGISDGFFTLQTAFVGTGDIAEAKGNLRTVGSLAAPAAGNEETFVAFSNIVKWLRAMHPSMRKNAMNLYMPTGIAMNIKDAASNKYRRLDRVNLAVLQELLREETLIKGLNIIEDACLGTGTRVFVTAPGNLDYGMTKKSNKQFVQIRTPYKDPNWVQFWMQLKVGQRIRVLHEKMFCMSEGTVESLSLSGDYQS